MNIFKWIVVGYLAFAILVNISRIGKVRRVKTPGEAICDAVEMTALGVLVVLA